MILHFLINFQIWNIINKQQISTEEHWKTLTR